MEFRIARGDKSRSLYLIGANLGVTQAIAILVFTLGISQSTVDYVDVVFEAASGTVAFLLFVAAAQVSVAGARMNWLLLGLFLFQTGALIDVLDEVVSFNFSFWSVAGDALRLGGELTLALVALLFVRLTNRIASTDRLTSLYNKGFHNLWIEEYLDTNMKTLGVIAIDLDKFKSINDAHGHAFGDTVLKHIGALLKDFMMARRGIASRTGGEEFELTLKSATEQSALALAEQVRALIEENPPAGIDLVTASIGVALSKEDESAVGLRKRADAAAYFSKKSGRNRVSVAGDNQTISNVEPA
jgi:diguanylate cyclase (GGDEF)-like protein